MVVVVVVVLNAMLQCCQTMVTMVTMVLPNDGDDGDDGKHHRLATMLSFYTGPYVGVIFNFDIGVKSLKIMSANLRSTLSGWEILKWFALLFYFSRIVNERQIFGFIVQL